MAERRWTSRDELLEAALLCLARGWSILPVGTDKRPHNKALISTGHARVNDQGREIGIWSPLQTERPTEEMVREWYSRSGRGLAVVTGQISGLIGLDYDGEDGRRIALSWGVDPHTESRSGGWHQYVRHPGWHVPTLQSHTNVNLRLIKGVDIRGDGGYLTLPPTAFQGEGLDVRYTSLRPVDQLDETSSVPDAWQQGDQLVNARALLHLDAPPVPVVRESRRGEYGVASLLSAGEQDEMARDMLTMALDKVYAGGHRNETGIWLAVQLRDHGLGHTELMGVMERYVDQVPGTNNQGQVSEYTLSEARGSVYQALRRPPREPFWKPRRERRSTRDVFVSSGEPSELKASADPVPVRPPGNAPPKLPPLRSVGPSAPFTLASDDDDLWAGLTGNSGEK